MSVYLAFGTCPADFNFTFPLAGCSVDANFDRKSFLQTFNFHCQTLPSRSADFPFTINPLRTHHSGSDVLIDILLQAVFSIHLAPPDPSNLSFWFSPRFLLADFPFRSSSDFLSIWFILSVKSRFESGTLVFAFVSKLPMLLVLWGFIRLPLILPDLSTGFHSILMLKTWLLRAFLRHLAISNLSLDFLPNYKPLQIYFFGILIDKDSIYISSFINLVIPDLRLPHLRQKLFSSDFSDSDTFFINPERLNPSAPGSILPVLWTSLVIHTCVCFTLDLRLTDLNLRSFPSFFHS